MDDLDLLKKDWQKPNAFEQISEHDIYGMFHKKSSSIVKWLLIISVLEFLLWTVLNLVFDSSKHFKENHQIIYINFIEYFGYAVILVFIYFLYRNYKKITTTVSTKQLMIDILKTKKIVQYYVWYNLTMIVLAVIVGLIYLFIFNPQNIGLKEKFSNDPKFLFIFIAAVIVMTIIFLVVFWLFYKLIYGILLKKLYVNYKELKKIDL